eukprot:3482311-Pyramimonas_sp.AAC.1
MWKYMSKNAGIHARAFGGRAARCNADSYKGPYSADGNVRKQPGKLFAPSFMPRAGTGAVVKRGIDASYRKGIAWWKDQRVAEWEDGAMKLSEADGRWKKLVRQFCPARLEDRRAARRRLEERFASECQI